MKIRAVNTVIPLIPPMTALAAADVVMTTLIVVRIIHLRRALFRLLPTQDFRLYTGPVAILIESALPLTIVGIAATVFAYAIPVHMHSPFGNAAYRISFSLFYSFTVSREHSSRVDCPPSHLFHLILS